MPTALDTVQICSTPPPENCGCAATKTTYVAPVASLPGLWRKLGLGASIAATIVVSALVLKQSDRPVIHLAAPSAAPTPSLPVPVTALAHQEPAAPVLSKTDAAAHEPARTAGDKMPRRPRARSQASDKQPHATRAQAGGAALPTPTASLEPAVSAPAREVDVVARARRQLDAQPADAMALLDKLKQPHPDGYLLEERAALRVLALSRLGRHASAKEEVRSFLRHYPRGPYSDQIGRLLTR